MPQEIATIVYIAGIIGLFYLDQNPSVRTSKALWIPFIWLLIIGSRPVSAWLHVGTAMTRRQVYEEGSPVDATVYGVLIAAGVIVLISRSPQVKRFLRGNAPLLLFFAYCALTIAWSDYPFPSLKRWIKAFGDPVMVLIVLTGPNPIAATKRCFSRAAFLLLPLSVLFDKYYPNLGRTMSKGWVSMYCGVTEFKNGLGMICLVCGLASLWVFLSVYQDRRMPNRGRHLAAHGIIIATAIFLCKAADSMTSLSCLLGAGLVMVLTTGRWAVRRTRAVHALVGGLVALSVFALFADETGLIVHALGRNATLTGRTEVWKAVLSMHTNPVFGTGFESFWMGSRLERVDEILNDGIQEAHNGYLEVYLNLGLVGIALLAGVIVSGYRNAIALFRRDPQAGRLRLAFLTASMIYSLTEAGFRTKTPIWVAFLFAVTIVPPTLQRKLRQRRSKSSVMESAAPAEHELAVPELV